MQFDPAHQSPADNYKLITNVVVPRPIAWVSTQSDTGVVNLAPFSFFNAIASNPPYVMISVGQRDNGELKDTATNILSRGEFVVNMVTEELFDAMNLSAADFPPEQSELDAAKLATSPCVHVKVPRVAQAKVSLECKLHSSQALGNYTLIIGQVVMFHVADDMLGPRLHVNNFAPLGRLGSPSVYCRSTDRFDIARVTFDQWMDKNT
ncbi:MAG: flavin reductase [Comamonadaceae bacterium CG1_02_60_18]|nr:MAG: flavin reductase [Comamonadaceae bacterium CG1_02_60_18]PIQ51881.1 MAG: flavin reductase [Comamonadaceae bacterium CG12_big_fil_rev_8_21_14_0_65_59_15]